MSVFRNSQRCISIVTMALLVGASGAASARQVDIPFDPNDFPGAPLIDNPFWPLGTFVGTFGYLAITRDGCEYNKLSDTGDTKMVDGVETSVFRDQAWETELDDDGECDLETAQLVEDTLDFYGQDFDANIRYFGEQTYKVDEETGPGTECSDEGSWEAGVDDAESGIIMLADPRPGDRYPQEYDEDNAEDWGAVLRRNAIVSDGETEYTDCLVIREWSPLEPGAVEQKFYCLNPEDGPGLVLIRELQGKTVTVHFVGDDLPAGLPGDGGDFPVLTTGDNATEGGLDCTISD